MSTLSSNFSTVEERLAAACKRVGRDRAEVTLVAVTKSVSTEVAAALAALGVCDLGENRPQELARKAATNPNVRWHMIGHLQRNKVELVLAHSGIIHAVDSVRLLHALELAAGKQGKSVTVFLEVNASGEASKQGFAPAEVAALVDTIAPLQHVQVRGLMTMAAPQEAEACRPTFVLMRQLRDQVRPRLPAPHVLEHLSMGMSNDFEVAVEEGATFVRVGSVLFEGIENR